LFYLLSIVLFQPHDTWIVLNELTRVNSVCILCLFLIDFFYNFIIQHWIGWDMSFIIYFNLYFTRISWFHDQDCGFWHFKSNFFIFFLKSYLSLMTKVIGPSTLDLHFISLSLFRNLRNEFGRLTKLTLFFSLFF
jgi:hypothetical protein